MIAAVDCGTNTIRLYVGDPPVAVLRESRVVRLGQGVDATGELAEEALARTFAAVEEYAALVAAHGVERIRVCATSATRDARNAQLFADGVQRRLGVRPDVVSGADEATLAFTGAVRHLASRHGPGLRPPVLVVDVGGGSTELALGEQEAGQVASLDIGSVRLAERHLRDDPATDDQLDAVVADVETQLDGVGLDLAAAATVVGVAGTVTTVAAAALDLPALDEDALDGRAIGADDVAAVVERLAAMTVAERRDLPYMHPGRADVIVAGALVLDRVLRRTGAPALVVSRGDILDGIAWSVAEPARRADQEDPPVAEPARPADQDNPPVAEPARRADHRDRSAAGQ